MVAKGFVIRGATADKIIEAKKRIITAYHNNPAVEKTVDTIAYLIWDNRVNQGNSVGSLDENVDHYCAVEWLANFLCEYRPQSATLVSNNHRGNRTEQYGWFMYRKGIDQFYESEDLGVKIFKMCKYRISHDDRLQRRFMIKGISASDIEPHPCETSWN